jgi:hypothetical protein
MIKNTSAYLIILLLIYGNFPVYVSVFFYSIIVISFALGGFKELFRLTFLLYPFMFLIKIPDHTNVFLIALPDILSLLSISFYLVSSAIKGPVLKHRNLITCLVILMVLNIIIPLLHVLSIEAIPVIFRQYILPIVFALVFLQASEKVESLVSEALTVSILSFSIVAAVSILNYLYIFTIPPVFEDVFPYVNYLRSLEDDEMLGRSFMGEDMALRLNPMLGGALGSSASILMTLSIIALLKFRHSVHRGLLFIPSIFLGVAAIFTISSSILFPIIIGIMLYAYIRLGRLMLLPAFIVGFIIINTIEFTNMSVFDYFYNAFIMNIYISLDGNTITSFLFGNGPKFSSTLYSYSSREYPASVGIFRVFLESGILNFTVFITLIYLIIKKYFKNDTRLLLMQKFPFIFLFLVMVSAVHTNLLFTAPFYPLFGLCVAGLYARSNNRSTEVTPKPNKCVNIDPESLITSPRDNSSFRISREVADQSY